MSLFGLGSEPREPADLLRDGGSNSDPNQYGGNHEVIYDRDHGSHISWDTYPDGTYVPGSGHTTLHDGGLPISWDR